MSEERSDEYILGRLIERSRLLIAISEEIPVETKLQAQPLLKQLEQLLGDETDGASVDTGACHLRYALPRAAGLRGPGRAAVRHAALPARAVSALANVKVLDLTRFLAGPFCTSLLADLGADVVKVEAPKGGDEGRYGYPTADGVPVFFLALNRNKRGITLSLRTDEGRQLLRRLLPHFDVLVENFAGGTLARWGLDPHALVAEHPRLIVASLSGFGQTGPWSARASYDIITQAAGGFMSLTGFPDNPPTRGGGSLGDYVQGVFGAVGVLGALVRPRRERSRAGGRRLGTGRDVLVARQLADDLLRDGAAPAAGRQSPPGGGAVRLLSGAGWVRRHRGREQQALPHAGGGDRPARAG